MAKYRKRPIIVDAEQWFPGHPVEGVIERANGAYASIRTLEGLYVVDAGDWIITGVKGERYPCKPDIFELTYEHMEEGEVK